MVTVWGTRGNHVCELGPRTHWTSVPDLAVTLSTSAPRAQEPLRQSHWPLSLRWDRGSLAQAPQFEETREPPIVTSG